MTNYRKGVQFERDLVNKAIEEGFISWRSAGSHSEIDVSIIMPSERKIRLIQCKTGKISPNALESLRQRLKRMEGHFYVTFEVLHKQHVYSKKEKI